MDETIFVQMASYRDSQLIPTLVDMVSQAASATGLRAVVCWQHATNERLAEFVANGFELRNARLGRESFAIHELSFGGAVIELIDVPHLSSQGVCWARNQIQRQYRSERYTLQLDSHHRFVRKWDVMLVEMLESLRADSLKPVLTAYPPSFEPDNDPAGRAQWPTALTFERFDADGFWVLGSSYIGASEVLDRPVPGRFYAAGFAFADGSFAVEVPHDPAYFFQGEEMSIAARAFTHGYDFYHPHRIVVWHQYLRAGCPKMWDDHSDAAKRSGEIELTWHERAARAIERNRRLFAVDHAEAHAVEFGLYGFGNRRTVAQYERLAGLELCSPCPARDSLGRFDAQSEQ